MVQRCQTRSVTMVMQGRGGGTKSRGDRRKGEAPEGVRQQERGVYLKGEITGGGDSMKGETMDQGLIPLFLSQQRPPLYE